MLGDEPEQGFEAGNDSCPRRSVGPLASLFDHHPHFGQGGVDRGEEQILLTVEVVVEGLASDGGAADDVGDLRRLIALLGAELGDRIHYSAALMTGDKLAR
jgi:hypothetical protein